MASDGSHRRDGPSSDVGKGEPALPALAEGDDPVEFGPYTLLEQLGQGGMALVYRAQRTEGGLHRDVVLKAMLPSLVKSAPLVEMFEAEARLTAQLRHPNIVQVEDFGVAGGIPYLIMEFLDGRNLSQLRNALAKKKRRVPVPLAVAIARELCLALGYAHHFVAADGKRMQIIHRDVSPSNVMVLRDGTVRLLDFGVAKLSSAAGQAVTTSLKGKFAYMAPEQVNQEPIDRRCDVFATGIVLHELLTNRRLFGTQSELETLRRVSLAEAAPPSQINPEVPPAVDALVMRALSRSPDDRFDSGVEMAAALDGLGLAAPRRELAAIIGEIFPPAIRTLEGMPTIDDLDDAVPPPFDDVTAPEHAVSSPHFVTAPQLVVLSDELSAEISSASAPRSIELLAEPSSSDSVSLAPPPAARPTPGFDEDAAPTGKSPVQSARATLIGKNVNKTPELAPLRPVETVAAPLDEIRPTRIYDPSAPAATERRPESDFEQRPTQIYDDGAQADPAPLPDVPSTPGRSVQIDDEPAPSTTKRAAVSNSHPPPAEPKLVAPPPPEPLLGVPTAFHGFEPLPPSTMAAPEPEPEPGSLRFFLGGLVVALVLAGALIGGRAYLWRHAVTPSEKTEVAPAVQAPPAAPRPVELALPEPQLPAIAPPIPTPPPPPAPPPPPSRRSEPKPEPRPEARPDPPVDRPRTRKPKSSSTVKEGRIVDPFESGE